MTRYSLTLIIALCFLSSCGPETSKTPEEEAFNNASKKTLSFKDEFAFGNTPDAQKRATAFSLTMNEEQKKMFSGGGILHGMTAGHFLTYCQLTPDEIIFICTVPGMKDYKNQARDALTALAWITAQEVSSDLSPKTTLVVALKGSLLYGPVVSGKVTGDPIDKADGREAMKPFYKAFLK